GISGSARFRFSHAPTARHFYFRFPWPDALARGKYGEVFREAHRDRFQFQEDQPMRHTACGQHSARRNFGPQTRSHSLVQAPSRPLSDPPHAYARQLAVAALALLAALFSPLLLAQGSYVNSNYVLKPGVATPLSDLFSLPLVDDITSWNVFIGLPCPEGTYSPITVA